MFSFNELEKLRNMGALKIKQISITQIRQRCQDFNRSADLIQEEFVKSNSTLHARDAKCAWIEYRI